MSAAVPVPLRKVLVVDPLCDQSVENVFAIEKSASIQNFYNITSTILSFLSGILITIIKFFQIIVNIFFTNSLKLKIDTNQSDHFVITYQMC